MTLPNAEETTISARVETALRDDLLAIARENDRSFSAELRRALRWYVLNHTVLITPNEEREEQAS